jgi:hypothetical protein
LYGTFHIIQKAKIRVRSRPDFLPALGEKPGRERFQEQ